MRVCIGLLQNSSYSVGLAYELLVIEVLKRYSFRLKHTGGAGDRGQDFSGYWILPNKRVPVVGQCKCYKKPVGPGDVREFENVLSRKFQSHKTHQSISGHLGVMASQNWFSASALRTFHSSNTPMIFCQILNSQESVVTDHKVTEPLNTTVQGVGGHISEVVLNRKAQNLLGNVQVTWRLNRHQNKQRNMFLLNL